MPSSVDLGPQLEKFVSSLDPAVDTNSKSEVLREGLQLLEEREKRIAALNAAISAGKSEYQSRTNETSVEKSLIVWKPNIARWPSTVREGHPIAQSRA